MMAVIVVDSSTIISCAMNCLLWIFDELTKKGITFIVPKGVKKEVVDSGLRSKKFKYESIRVIRHFSNGTFQVYEGDLRKEASKLLSYSNSSFYIRHNPMRILQEADAEVAALAKKIKADAILTDEKTLRMLIESHDFVKKMLEKKFGEKIRMNESALHSFVKNVGNIEIIRSVDLIALAYSLGVFDEMLKKCFESGEIASKKDLIEGLLFALKFSGCAVSFKEINDYVNILLKER